MNSSYLHDLRLFKATFNPGDEADVIAKAVSASLPKGRLRILDVGIGEARSTFRAVEWLNSEGYSIQLTGLDLHISERTRMLAPPDTEFRELAFHLLPPTEVFDVVIATQSLYYLGNWEQSLKKLLLHTKPKGCLLVTIWTDNCTLCRLYNQFRDGHGNRLITAENVSQAAHCMDAAASVQLVHTPGTLNIKAWRDDARISAAAFRILTRSNDDAITNLAAYGPFCQHLTSLQDEELRENGTVVILRGANTGPP